MKRFLAMLLTVCMLATGIPAWATNDSAALGNFETANTYNGGFIDVEQSSWYFAGVESAYEYGLMAGNSANTFNPTGKITIAEMLVIASRMHDIYYGGDGKFTQGSVWYQVYVDYAKENGLISADEFSDYTVAATRAQFASILARVLPAEELEAINSIDKIPDVSADAIYLESVHLLYTAGILTGSDQYGSFHPNDTIQRCEVATIVTRMVDVTQRKSFTLVIKVAETETKEISYYPDTNVPTYTSVTGIECAEHPDGTTQYFYPLTKNGTRYTALDYLDYLYQLGWWEQAFTREETEDLFTIGLAHDEEEDCFVALEINKKDGYVAIILY